MGEHKDIDEAIREFETMIEMGSCCFGRSQMRQYVALLSELRTLREATRWRDANDEAAEMWQSVLVLTDEGEFYVDCLNDADEWQDNGDMVTHWLPLPTPPSAESGEP